MTSRIHPRVRGKAITVDNFPVRLVPSNQSMPHPESTGDVARNLANAMAVMLRIGGANPQAFVVNSNRLGIQ